MPSRARFVSVIAALVSLRGQQGPLDVSNLEDRPTRASGRTAPFCKPMPTIAECITGFDLNAEQAAAFAVLAGHILSFELAGQRVADVDPQFPAFQQA